MCFIYEKHRLTLKPFFPILCVALQLVAYFQSSESYFYQFCHKVASINRDLELEAPNADLEEAARAEQVLERFNPSHVMLNTFTCN